MMSIGLILMMFVGDRRVSGGLGGPAALTPPPQLRNACEGAGKQQHTSWYKNMITVRRGGVARLGGESETRSLVEDNIVLSNANRESRHQDQVQILEYR